MKFILLIIALCLPFQANAYGYSVDRYYVTLGSPYNYPMDFDQGGNYFFDHNGKIFFAFLQEKTSDAAWAGGKLTQSASTYNHDVPHGVHIRWFSSAENQFWEAEYTFDQALLKTLSNLEIHNTFTDKKDTLWNTAGGRNMPYINIYVVPDGLVTVWIGGEGKTQLLVAQFKAKKMVNAPDWNTFYRRALAKRYGKEIQTREHFITQRLQDNRQYVQEKLDGAADFFDTQQITSPITAEPWLKNMKKYPWFFSLNKRFTLQGSHIFYVNGEQYFTPTSKEALSSDKAIPRGITFNFQDTKTKELLRAEIVIDIESAQQAYEKLSMMAPRNKAITLQFTITDDLKRCNLKLIKGKESITLNMKAQLIDRD